MSITAANGVQIAKMVKMKWQYKAPVVVAVKDNHLLHDLFIFICHYFVTIYTFLSVTVS